MNELSNIENISPEVPRTAELPRTPEIVGAEVRTLTTAARQISLKYAIEIGRRLVEAKELVPHGGWLDWLKRETEFSQPSANRFMKLFDAYGADQQSLFGTEAKYSTLNNLSVSNALLLLAVPEDEREEYATEVDAEHLSARELEAAIKERDEARKALQTSEARLEDAQRTLADSGKQLTELRGRLDQARADLRTADSEAEANERELKARIAELEARPVDVAVAEPDPAEIEKRAEELAKAAKEEALKQADAKIRAIAADASAEKAKLEDKLKALEKSASEDRAELVQKIREAEAKLAEAQDSTREEELAALKKQLAMSGAELVTFKLRFGAWQEAYTAMRSALEAVPAEQRSNCEAAIRAVVKGWSENA